VNRRALLLAVAIATLVPKEASAIRWTLGVATQLVPVVVDPDRPDDRGLPFRIGVRPVVDLELARAFAIGVYAPFTVFRSGEGDGAAASGAEAVFGLNANVRYPIVRAEAPEEILLFGSIRGGFGTLEGRAGPYYGASIGSELTWLDTGRGLFAELEVGRFSVDGVSQGGDDGTLQRTTVGLTIGFLFRFGGEAWKLER
jgi:hypothetical protein